MKRLAASVFLIFFGFVVAACGSGEAEQSLNSAFAEADGLSTGESSVDNPGSGEGQGDGRVLKPEGHKGMWFETEPEDPWEHYVWKSQRFVNDRIELPKLTNKGYKSNLSGLPDICDQQVVNRLEEIGFEREGSIENYFDYSCDFFEVQGVEGAFLERMFHVVLDPARPIEKLKSDVSYKVHRDDVVTVENSKGNEKECAIAQSIDGVNFNVENVSWNPKDAVLDKCRYSEYFFQIFDNIAEL
ncbi:hypothetical protein [Corynebacterium macclintockiae]|uniref:hypothetical protein n=1 Tax=Corynebacterium macclintockiae TaxID=2913501 RepID=UPI003EBFAF0B